MAVVWKIAIGAGAPVTFESLGLGDLRRRLVSQAQSRVTFVQDTGEFTDDAICEEGDTVTITRVIDDDDPEVWFVGRALDPRRSANGTSEAIVYELACPWWYLDNLIFQQNWKIPVTPADPASALTNQKRSTLILNLKEDGSTLTTRQQIKEAVDFAIAAGAPLAIDDASFPAINVPWDEARDLSCAEVIRRQLRLAPDVMLRWDFATTPPTLRCVRRAAADAITFPLGEGDRDQLSIVPRNDLLVPAVVLNFESTNVQDEASWTSVTQQKYPAGATGLEFGVPVATIQLGGSVSTVQRQKLKTRAIPAAGASDADKIAYLKRHLKWLNDAKVSTITISDYAIARHSAGWVNEVWAGSIPEWKRTAGGKVTITALVSYTVKHTSSGTDLNEAKVVKKPISIEVTGTSLAANTDNEDPNAGWSTFSRWIPLQNSEAVPVGLAQAVYEALSSLQYEGTFTIIEDEMVAVRYPGQVLNLTGGRAEWAAMKAQIQSIEERVDNCETTFGFGPAKHLGPQDLLELLRPWRTRTAATSAPVRTQGLAVTNALTEGAPASENGTSSGAAGPFSKLVLVDPANPGRKLTLDAEAMLIELTDGSKKFSLALADLAAGEVVSARTSGWCDGGNKTGRVLRGAGA